VSFMPRCRISAGRGGERPAARRALLFAFPIALKAHGHTDIPHTARRRLWRVAR
jgi:hypothetical protein